MDGRTSRSALCAARARRLPCEAIEPAVLCEGIVKVQAGAGRPRPPPFYISELLRAVPSSFELLHDLHAPLGAPSPRCAWGLGGSSFSSAGDLAPEVADPAADPTTGAGHRGGSRLRRAALYRTPAAGSGARWPRGASKPPRTRLRVPCAAGGARFGARGGAAGGGRVRGASLHGASPLQGPQSGRSADPYPAPPPTRRAGAPAYGDVVAQPTGTLATVHLRQVRAGVRRRVQSGEQQQGSLPDVRTAAVPHSAAGTWTWSAGPRQ